VKDLRGGKVGERYRQWRYPQPRRVRNKWLLGLLFIWAATLVTWRFALQKPAFNASQSLTAKTGGASPRSQRDDHPSQARQSDWRPLPRPVGRITYPYSVIPGGVLNPDELKHAVEYDPVVSRHFQGFDYQHAHLVKVSAKQALYVSYRIGDRVYWTRRKVSLPPGETLITDGTIAARTRCGNRVARVPLGPSSPLEPLPDELEGAIPLRDPVPTPPTISTANPAPETASPVVNSPKKAGWWWFIPPPIYIPTGSSGSSGGPLAVTPEPGSILLISSGLAAVYWRSRKARKKK
jgi:hypothetical protein